MIISCPACKTKYRLDENQIPDDGAWLRCSRCHHVFFHASVVKDTELKEDMEIDKKEKMPIRRKTRWIWITGPAIIIIVLLGLFFAIYVSPEKTFFPFSSRSSIEESRLSSQAPLQIKIQDLRQYFVENATLGRIRVVQGMAVNMSSRSMTRIKVKAELYDILNVRVAEGVSYCGNILTEQELATATEEEITKRLLQPLGTEVSTQKVPPHGMVPFLIVFLREPPGVEKTLVSPVEAEYLLP